MAMSLPARALIGAAITLLVVSACSPAAAAPASTAAPTPAPTSTAAPTPTPTAASTATLTPSPMLASSPAASGKILDTSSLGDAFALELRMPIPDGWFTLLPPSTDPDVPAGTLNVLYGDPNGNRDRWAGPGFALVDGAMVRDPAKDVPTGKWDFIPWPASYIDYLTKLHGVEILDGPTATTIGGQAGREVLVRTPAMAPTIWLKGDYAWLGGGQTGVDPGMGRYLVEVNVKGTRLLIEYDDASSHLQDDVKEVKGLLAGIQF